MRRHRHPASTCAASLRRLAAEVQHVDVSSGPGIVGQVVTGIVGIVVENDVIAIPVPVADVAEIGGGNAEKESAKPEALRSATLKSPDMARAYLTGKAPVLPRMIKVIALIVAPGIVSDPLIVVDVHVGRVRVPLAVIKLAIIRNLATSTSASVTSSAIVLHRVVVSHRIVRSFVARRRRPALRDVPSTDLGMAALIATALLRAMLLTTTLRRAAAAIPATFLLRYAERN